MNDQEFVEAAYRIVLRRTADPEGAGAAVATLRDGQQTRSAFVVTLLRSPEFADLQRLDALILDSGTGAMHDLRAPAGTDERQIEIPWVLSRARSARRILDVGYAHARDPYLEALQALDVDELVGVDLATREVAGMRSVVADLRELPFSDGEFDLVLCVSTLEHVGCDNTIYGLPDERDSTGMSKAMQEFRRVVASNGTILITVPCGIEEHHGWFVQLPPTSWLRAFEQASLRISEHEIYELTGEGWRSVAGDPAVRYGENGPGASAVLCAAATR